MRRSLYVGLIASAFLSLSCSSLGPKANLSIIETETNKTKSVNNIMIANVTGIDATGTTSKIVMASALKTYGARSRPNTAANSILAGNGGWQDLSEILAANYQAEFAKLVEKNAADPNMAKPKEIKLAKGADTKLKIPKGEKGLKDLMKRFAAENQKVSELATALRTGNNQSVFDTMDRSKVTASLVRSFSDRIFEHLNVTYVLVTHIVGDEAAWEKGKEVYLGAALVNAKTGKMRYYVTTQAKKGSEPVPYATQMGIMSNTIFDAVNDQDPLPEITEKKTAAAVIRSSGVDG